MADAHASHDSSSHRSSAKGQELPLEFYKVIVEHMTEGLWVGDTAHHTLYVNPAFERLFGYDASEWKGSHSFDYFDESNQRIIQQQNLQRRSGKSGQYEVEVLSKTGEPIPVLMSGAPTPDGGTVGIMMDMRPLKESEERYQNLVEAMNEGVWVGDKQNRTLYANPAFLSILGYRLDEIRQKEFSQFLAPDAAFSLSVTKRKKNLKGSHEETTLLSSSGERIPTILHVSPFAKGYLMTVTDLRSLRSLEHQARELQTVAQYSLDAMVSLDVNHVIRAWNVGAERMFGWDAKEMIGKPFSTLFPLKKLETDELSYLAQEAEKRGFLRNHETLALHKNGALIQVALTYTALKDDANKLLGYSAVYRDITMQKQWERDLQRRFDKMQEAYMEMGKLRRYMDYLGELTELCVKGAPQADLQTFAVHAILMFTKADAVVLRLVNPAEQLLELAATAGSLKDWDTKGSPPLKNSLAEQAFAQKKALKFLDITQEPQYRSAGLARKNNLRSLLLVPLQVGDHNLGTLSIYISTDKSLDVLDHEFIPLFARQIAMALKLSMP